MYAISSGEIRSRPVRLESAGDTQQLAAIVEKLVDDALELAARLLLLLPRPHRRIRVFTRCRVAGGELTQVREHRGDLGIDRPS